MTISWTWGCAIQEGSDWRRCSSRFRTLVTTLIMRTNPRTQSDRQYHIHAQGTMRRLPRHGKRNSPPRPGSREPEPPGRIAPEDRGLVVGRDRQSVHVLAVGADERIVGA